MCCNSKIYSLKKTVQSINYKVKFLEEEMGDEGARIVVFEQQTFLERFDKLSPNLSKTLKEYISQNNLSISSSDNYKAILQHAQGLSSEHTLQG